MHGKTCTDDPQRIHALTPHSPNFTCEELKDEVKDMDEVEANFWYCYGGTVRAELWSNHENPELMSVWFTASRTRVPGDMGDCDAYRLKHLDVADEYKRKVFETKSINYDYQYSWQ